ncbi:phosphate ABC transporter substrate-binding protein, PhoT family [Rivularia sp. PCC 7116]|uniref:substrate-binding domain-containing protein n=1 Tax=Rivularia sp. PCC 7116 TaxID=373994 RepID=UPI00029EC5FE|nr:substrate-binding domain-containing protein [Rivularia sp. PCC 7116]AFY57777.1 phosphate ABC transporter substrate-binding protein, PhoT family [Rivularia sp. PCC 7116]
MSKRSGPPPIVYILIALALIGGGYWWFFKRDTAPQTSNQISSENPVSQDNQPIAEAFPAPASVPSGTTIDIDGSTSMVTINQNLKRGFESKFPGTNVFTRARGSSNGIQGLIDGTIDVAAVSRPLTQQEQSQGLVAVPVANDAIAIIIGIDNTFVKKLSSNQVADIFQGKVNNWSQVGGSNGNIQVINRPPVSGTHQAFKELVLQGNNFATTSNITTLPRDETTGLIRALGNNGIGYATYAQVQNQSTARVLPIDGMTPQASNYPYTRKLFYVYKNPPSPQVQAFLGYTTSPEGQQAGFFGN